MKKIYFWLICLVTFTSAQDLRFEFDYAQFRYDTTSNYLEIYYSIIPSDFNLTEENGKFYVKGKMHIQIQKSETHELVVNKEWGLSQPLKDTSEYKNGNALLGVIGFNLQGGEYTIDISVEDILDPTISKSYSEKLSVNAFNRSTYSVSNIELATRILNENTNKNSIFYKNTLEVFPNPSVIFTQNSPVMFYYCELYDLNKANSENIVLTRSLFNSNNYKVYENSKKLNSLKESIVEVGLVNLKKYPTDSYTFVITISNEDTKEFSSSSKKLYLVNPDVIASNTSDAANSNYISSEFGVLNDEECDNLFEKSKIIATSNEIDQFNGLDSLSKKREYLYNFWKKRDDNPSTPINEFKRMFLTRINVANERYRTISSSGFKTDRGRVFVRLGEPDEIERHPNETNTKPYEIWYYHQIEGGVYFIFGDYTGFNFYELLHSTMRGELQDPQWARRIQTK